MDKVPFRKKPKIADLTSERRLADKVLYWDLSSAFLKGSLLCTRRLGGPVDGPSPLQPLNTVLVHDVSAPLAI